MRLGLPAIVLSMLTAGPALGAGPSAKPPRAVHAIAMPGGKAGIGFDDLGFSRGMGRLLVPAGRTGMLDLVDPVTGKVTSVSGFSVVEKFSGGHDDGITSVAEGGGLLFVTDRTSLKLSMVDPVKRTIVGDHLLGASPDYVRWYEASRELWVTEPDSERIEVFHLDEASPPHVTPVATIEIPGGPESLVLDARRGHAYTHAAEGKTLAIDLKTHAVVDRWSNGCKEATGIALDSERGFLFVACEEGGLKVLDAGEGKSLGSIDLGSGVDIISYSPELRHVYVPSAEAAKLSVVGVSPQGSLSLLGTLPGTPDSHCVAVGKKVYLADPAHGSLRVVADPYPASTR